MRTWEQIAEAGVLSSYKPCPLCSGPMANHAKACQKCGVNYKRGEEHPKWKGDAASDVKKRKRAANVKRTGPCEECGAPGVDRHHRDGNPGNNVPENIALLCRRCHMRADGRLDAFMQMATRPKPQKPPAPCANCGRLSKPLRRGRCHACNEYFRRNGFERALPKLNGQTSVASELAEAVA